MSGDVCTCVYVCVCVFVCVSGSITGKAYIVKGLSVMIGGMLCTEEEDAMEGEEGHAVHI